MVQQKKKKNRQQRNKRPRTQALHKQKNNENSCIRKIKDLLKDSLLVLSFPGNNFTPLDLSSPELFTGWEQ